MQYFTILNYEIMNTEWKFFKKKNILYIQQTVTKETVLKIIILFKATKFSFLVSTKHF